jgi:predicted nucleic acid-binding Zn finger protein
MDTYITKVQFYKHSGEVYAILPETKLNNLFDCYAHVGQHGSAVQEYINESRPAKVVEYKDLLTELTSIGYNVLVVPAKPFVKDLGSLTELIGIGFCQPKFYKRNVWLKAKEIMDYLVSLNVGVVEHNFGHGKGKYITTKEISNGELAHIVY